MGPSANPTTRTIAEWVEVLRTPSSCDVADRYIGAPYMAVLIDMAMSIAADDSYYEDWYRDVASDAARHAQGAVGSTDAEIVP